MPVLLLGLPAPCMPLWSPSEILLAFGFKLKLSWSSLGLWGVALALVAAQEKGEKEKTIVDELQQSPDSATIKASKGCLPLLWEFSGICGLQSLWTSDCWGHICKLQGMLRMYRNTSVAFRRV